MPTVHANGIDIYYEVQGEGEPIVLIPYLAADQQCYAFQVQDYAKHFKCFTVDLRDGNVACGQVPYPGEVAITAQPVAENGPVPARRRRKLADHGSRARQCHRTGDQGNLSMVPHP